MKRQNVIDDFHHNLASIFDATHGYAIAGWSSKRSQNDRFEALLRTSKFAGGTIVDYGCGLGDLYGFLKDQNIQCSYRGLDQSADMVRTATSKYGDHFSVIAIDSVDFSPPDYIFASGVFQFKDDENVTYYLDLLNKLFSNCRKATCVNFLSAERKMENTDPHELYITPQQAISIAHDTTKFWAIDHSYHPGGGDMTLALFRREISAEWTRPSH